MIVTANDNTEQVLDALDDAIERALTRIGLSAEGYAKKELTKNKNVDTGLLRNSITFAISGEPANISSYKADKGNGTGSYSGNAPEDKKKSVYIGTNVEYAAYVELGTSKSKAYPYLKPAATEHNATYKRILEDEMKKG